MATKNTAKLRELIGGERCINVPGCFDPLTARMVERAGFQAAYLSAWSLQVAQLGLPHLGVATITEYVDLAARITSVIDIPLIVDIENGLGGPLEVRRAVRELERIGVAAVSINDQTRGMGWMVMKDDMVTGFVSDDQMTAKLGAAKAAQSDPDFVVIGRTDATRISADEGIRRCNAWVGAGADVAMPMISPWVGYLGNKAGRSELHTVIRRFVADINAPVMVHSSFGLDFAVEEANQLGLRIYVVPQACLGYSAAATWRALKALRSDRLREFAEGSPYLSNDEFGEVLDFDYYTALVQQFGV